jgi:hypothetical protein
LDERGEALAITACSDAAEARELLITLEDGADTTRWSINNG